jgi:hypothetical protein
VFPVRYEMNVYIGQNTTVHEKVNSSLGLMLSL